MAAVLLPPSSDRAEAQGESPQLVLARPAVDATLFRDGEVHRRNEMHGRWSLDCDEVPRLRQRFCSLRSLATDDNGVAVARITVSTDDAGRPAALIDLPADTSLARTVTIEAGRGLVVGLPTKALEQDADRAITGTTGRRRGHPGRTAAPTSPLSAHLSPELCDPHGCHAVWSLTPVDVAALRAGAGLRLRFGVVARSLAAFPMQATLVDRAVSATVSSDGFSDAIAASVR